MWDAVYPLTFPGMIDNVAELLKDLINTFASDSSKSERHGDGGRSLEAAERQIAELEESLKNAEGRDKVKIKNKIKNIRKAAEKARKGDTDWRRGGNNGRR